MNIGVKIIRLKFRTCTVSVYVCMMQHANKFGHNYMYIGARHVCTYTSMRLWTDDGRCDEREDGGRVESFLRAARYFRINLAATRQNWKEKNSFRLDEKGSKSGRGERTQIHSRVQTLIYDVIPEEILQTNFPAAQPGCPLRRASNQPLAHLSCQRRAFF